MELAVIQRVLPGTGLSRSTLVQPRLDCKVVQTDFTLKLAHQKVSTERLLY